MYIHIPRNYARESLTRQYTMLIQNTASREIFVLDELENLSASPLYYTFDITMPDAAQAGEYTYYVISYASVAETDAQPLLSKIQQIDGTTVLLRDLRPEIGLIMYNTAQHEVSIYPQCQTSFIYYENE